LFDPHAPYDPPEAFRQSDPYRGEVAFADSSLGPLLADWDGRPGTSVVAVTGDHGEAFGEHGEESHSLFVYDTTLRVPLVLRGAGVPRGRRAREPVSLADLGATLLSLVPGRSDGLPGRNLLDGSKPGPLYAETLAPRLDFGWSDLRAWRDGRYKYIRAPRPELYDLAADSGETQNLAAREPALARRMAEALERALADMGDHESERPVEPDAAGRLHTLGYVQGPGGRGSGADPKDMLPVALRIARAGGPFPDHAAAVRAYREILALDPRNPLVNFRLADALLRSGHAAEAMEFFRTVVASGPRTADAHLGLAIACARLGRLEEASRVLQQALVLDPRNGQVQYDLGEVARARGDTAGARARYEAALDDPVTRARALTRLAELR
jgi:tetratricopeptide (TPR) repeat protein